LFKESVAALETPPTRREKEKGWRWTLRELLYVSIYRAPRL